MATIKSNFVGSVLAVNAIGQTKLLKANDDVPDGFFVGGHAIDGGDPEDQVAPWDKQGIKAADILDATEVGIAVLTAEDEEAARDAIGAEASA